MTTVRRSDDTETVTITITGSNDAPVITDGPDTAGLTETDAALLTAGTLTVGDVDTTMWSPPRSMAWSSAARPTAWMQPHRAMPHCWRC